MTHIHPLESHTHHDEQGDRNNIVYGALYRMDLAAYLRHDPLRTAAGARPHFGYAYGSR